jgi:hypothetical protein
MKRVKGSPSSAIDSCRWIKVITRERRLTSSRRIARNRREFVNPRWIMGERTEKIMKITNIHDRIERSTAVLLA